MLFSEPKIPQLSPKAEEFFPAARFSALQRAENSSTVTYGRDGRNFYRFQCSSASRKFLNLYAITYAQRAASMFQCSSASRKFLNLAHFPRPVRNADVSVLFSEPKIPQRREYQLTIETKPRFQCSSASRKFLNREIARDRGDAIPFQCSSASRKFLNPTLAPASIRILDCDDRASSFLSLSGASP